MEEPRRRRKTSLAAPLKWVGLTARALLGPPAQQRSDDVHDQLESWILRSAQEARNPDDLRGLLRIADASEMIFDAAREMTRLVEKVRSSIR